MTAEMTRWVALLRGVNVGGHNKVPMAAFRAMANGFGWQDVQSYIASGNLVFAAAGRAESLSAQLAQGLREQMNVDVPVLVLSSAAMSTTLQGCPFDRDSGKAVHGFFCTQPPVIDTEVRDRWISATERLAVVGQTVWFNAPEGVGRSKLMARIDKVITGTEFTARNLNTIITLTEMLDSGS